LSGLALPALLSAGCGPTLLDQLTPTPGVPTTAQFATALVTPGGSSSTTFTVTGSQVIGIALVSVVGNVSGAVLSPTLNLTIGTQTSATTCTPLSTRPVTPQLTANVQQTLSSGTYCVAVSGIGLSEASVITVRINTSAQAPTTTANPTAIDTFTSTIGPKGVANHELTLAFNGLTSVELLSTGVFGGALGVGFGAWDGLVCRLNTQGPFSSGTDPIISVTVDPGTYCIQVTDAGGLTAPIFFTIATTHP
jgi:hypothetical protein